MVSDYLIHRCESCQKALTILQETLERRIHLDEVIQSRLDSLDLELTMLLRELKKEK